MDRIVRKGILAAFGWAVCAGAALAEPPRVVATSPANGANVAAGEMELSVTFDQKMAPDSYSFVTSNAAAYPPCPPPATQSADGMTFTLKCTTEPGKSYALWFNGGSHMNFKNLDSEPATPTELRFSTAP
jgi:hypothetical protein